MTSSSAMTWTQDHRGDSFATSPSGRRFRYHYLDGLFVYDPTLIHTWRQIPHGYLYTDDHATEDVLAYEQSLEGRVSA